MRHTVFALHRPVTTVVVFVALALMGLIASRLLPLEQFPDCPTDALDDAGGPVEITFWHGMNDVLEDSLIELTDAYNASQDKVKVTLQNQTGYDAAIGGSRRDEERSRAKERIFSLRMPGHRWEPRRP